MMIKPIRALELHYPLIHFLIIGDVSAGSIALPNFYATAG